MPEEPTDSTAAPAPDRHEAALRALLGETLTPATFRPVGTMRPFSAGVFASLHRTWNEWVLGVPRDEMHDPRLATLAWLFIQAGPLDEVRRVIYGDAVFDPGRFHVAVIAWADRTGPDGEPLFTAAMLDAAMKLIADTLAAKKAVDFEIAKKPDAPPPDANEPPN